MTCILSFSLALLIDFIYARFNKKPLKYYSYKVTAIILALIMTIISYKKFLPENLKARLIEKIDKNIFENEKIQNIEIDKFTIRDLLQKE